MGASAGNAVCGVIVDVAPPRAGLVLTAGLGALAFATGLLGRRRLAMPPIGAMESAGAGAA
jgi:hypothetical protein